MFPFSIFINLSKFYEINMSHQRCVVNFCPLCLFVTVKLDAGHRRNVTHTEGYLSESENRSEAQFC